MNESNSNENSGIQNKLDTSDFLAFSDSACAVEFSPAVSSSPQKPWYNNNSRNNSPYYFNNRSYGNSRHTYNNTLPHKVFKSFDNKQRKPNFKGSNSFNSYFQKSKNDSFNSGRNDSSNILNYLHPSFMENPWESLEKRLNDSNRSSKNSSKDTIEDCINESVEDYINEASEESIKDNESYNNQKVED
ncbi:hypothetical protein RI129_006148 [Pyrocoelia pectoralis]|uniref:Uncharacterized protein n=1 Tax=Pyrocoelia pectoralis TaxID=417401 RepID=A0AAN7VDL0_9COLE